MLLGLFPTLLHSLAEVYSSTKGYDEAFGRRMMTSNLSENQGADGLTHTSRQYVTHGGELIRFGQIFHEI
jgi:hypothetical protein